MRRRSSGEGTTIRPLTLCSEVQMPDEELMVLVTKRTPGNESNYNSTVLVNNTDMEEEKEEIEETQQDEVAICGANTEEEQVSEKDTDERKKEEKKMNERQKVVRKLSFLEETDDDLGQSKNSVGMNSSSRNNQTGSKERICSSTEGVGQQPRGEGVRKNDDTRKSDDERRKSTESIAERRNSINVTCEGGNDSTYAKNQVSIEESSKRNEGKRTRFSSSRKHTGKVDDTRRKVLRMTSLLIITFVACWTPYAIIATYDLFDEKAADQMAPIKKILYFFAVSNSCINPYLYGNLFRFWREKRGRRRLSGNAAGTTKKPAHPWTLFIPDFNFISSFHFSRGGMIEARMKCRLNV